MKRTKKERKTAMKRTKKEEQMIWAYQRAEKGSRLESVYKTCSYEKIRAEKEILATMKYDHGFDYRITGKSSNFFSCGYLYKDGNKVMLAYFTYARRYDMMYEEQ